MFELLYWRFVVYICFYCINIYFSFLLFKCYGFFVAYWGMAVLFELLYWRYLLLICFYYIIYIYIYINIYICIIYDLSVMDSLLHTGALRSCLSCYTGGIYC